MRPLIDLKLILQRFFRTYIYGSVHIALIGGFAYYLIHFSEIFIIEKSTLIGCMIFFYYSLSQLICIRDYEKIKGNEELEWVNRNMTEIVFAMGFSLVFICMIYFQLKTWIGIKDIIILCAIGFSYFFIKHIPIIRNLVIGLAWYWVLCINTEAKPEHIILYTLYFSFISYIYDRVFKIQFKFLVDLLILLPFIF